MRRRIFLAILATVILTLGLAAAGTVLVLQREANRTSESNVRAEADRLAALLTAARNSTAASLNQQQVVSTLRVEGFSVLVEGPGGNRVGEVPAGLDPSVLDPDALVAGSTVSGQSGDLTWAAATVSGVSSSTVTIVVARPTEAPRAPVGWFLLTGALAFLVAMAVALWLSDTLTRPLRRAHEATGRIAAGDLTTNLPEPKQHERDEVADLTRSINAMSAALARSRGLERQFILSVSHDLRTPLTSIRGYADAISDGTADQPAAAASIISSEAQRLGRLVGDLLDLGRLDTHEFSFDIRPFPLDDLVSDVAATIALEAETAGVDVVFEDGAGPVWTHADPDRLAQALGNLLENALKYAMTTVTVATAPGPTPDTVLVIVTDDGPGIAPKDVDHIFDRLAVSERQPRRTVGGTGLGLAIVHQLITRMNGRVWAESPATSDGMGARLSIELRTLPAGTPSTTSPSTAESS